METYFDNDGKLLPKFYTDPKWKVMGSILLTVFDCTCCIATWGFAIYLVVLKSLFIIAYSLLCPCPSKVDISKENLPKEARDASTRGRRIQSSSLEEHQQKSRPSSSAASKSEKSAKSPETKSREAEIVRQLSEASTEASSHANEFKDPPGSP